MTQKVEANRYIQLTESGLTRLEAAMRKCRIVLDDIAYDRETPSRNTVKRALRRGPVFLNTLDRIWEFLQRNAEEKGVALPDLRRGEDYQFVESDSADDEGREPAQASKPLGGKRGWLSRQVPRKNRLFTGRAEALERLHLALKAGPAALVPDPQALTGLGGIGKTQTAAAYVYEHWNDYNGVFWVNAETVEDLDDGLASLAEELQLPDSVHASKTAALRVMHEWFQTQSGWLLVLDNADDIATLESHFPRHHTGSLLLTTRLRNTVKWAAPVELVTFSQREGAMLLLRRAGLLSPTRPLDDAPHHVTLEAMELSGELGGLPLALDQAGAYIAETGISLTDYMAAYRGQGLDLLDRAIDDHRSVSITFKISLDQLAERSDHGRAGADLVRVCAFLAPDVIPDALFTSCPFLQEGTDGRTPSEFLTTVFDAVCAYSLVTRSPQHKTLTVHRLVQLATRELMTEAERRHWAMRAVEAVAVATPDFEFEDWPLCDLLLPHWRVCAANIRLHAIATARAAYLLYQAGRYCRRRALYLESESLLKESIQMSEAVHGADNPTTADYIDELACLYRELDRPMEAGPLHERAVHIVETVLGPEHSHTASKLHNMALHCSAQQEYARAKELFLRVIAIRETQLPENALHLAAAHTQLGGVYLVEDSFESAEQSYRSALDTYEGSLPPDHVDIATGCNNLALLYMMLGRCTESEALFTRALKINEKVRGKEHPETGVVLWGLALVRAKQERAEEANELFMRAIRIHERHFGRGHSRLARLRSQYAKFLEASGYTRPPAESPM